IMNVNTIDNRTGRRVVASVGPIIGGAGGSPFGDGTEGSGANSSFLKNTPVEINEVEVPIKIHRYGLASGSGGAGEHRGGTAIEMWFEALAPNTKITARNMDRTRFTSWGVQGGGAGSLSYFLLNPNTDKERDLGNLDFLTIGPGDIIHVASGGAGGWGNPLKRHLKLVQQDVQRGFVSQDSAKKLYGVILNDGVIDQSASDILRKKMCGEVSINPNFFDYGKGRTKFELVWTRKNYDLLTGILAAAPVHWRFFIKHRLFNAIGDEAAENNHSRIKTLFDEILEEFPQLKESMNLR
ncbi:MAG: hydantoinase B/oxoprolinase family protein, partial [Alphaproteobacteria bacterium]|nr:hydantoinase B/oxoprolinase family protein [Alphaproteobacteria bacterium]